MPIVLLKSQKTIAHLHLLTFQLLEYQWSEGEFDEQTSSDLNRRLQQVYDWGNLNASYQNCWLNQTSDMNRQ